MKASVELEKENLHVTVIDLFSLKPIEAEKSSKKIVLTVEDHYLEGGIFGNG
jgi:transketolase C-terminal domain/subunit